MIIYAVILVDIQHGIVNLRDFADNITVPTLRFGKFNQDGEHRIGVAVDNIQSVVLFLGVGDQRCHNKIGSREHDHNDETQYQRFQLLFHQRFFLQYQTKIPIKMITAGITQRRTRTTVS